MTPKNNFVRWSDYRNEIMTAEEQAKSAEFVAEVGKLIEARECGKITVDEYAVLCFELDKKYGLATDEDYSLYFDDDDFEDVDESENISFPQLIAHF